MCLTTIWGSWLPLFGAMCLTWSWAVYSVSQLIQVSYGPIYNMKITNLEKTNAVLPVAYQLLAITSDISLKFLNCLNDCQHQHHIPIRSLTVTVLHSLKLKFEAIKNSETRKMWNIWWNYLLLCLHCICLAIPFFFLDRIDFSIKFIASRPHNAMENWACFLFISNVKVKNTITTLFTLKIQNTSKYIIPQNISFKYVYGWTNDT